MANSGIQAVVVTLDPDLIRLGGALVATQAQVERLIVVDNGSATGVREWLQGIAAARGIELISLDTNIGLAAGLNDGIQRALNAGARHILLLDQDSVPEPDMVAELVAVANTLNSAGVRVGGVGPRYVDARTGALVPIARRRMVAQPSGSYAAASPIPVDFLITSGSLLDARALREIGEMDETLFIEHVDTDWCFRALAAKFGLFVAERARMRHAPGIAMQQLAWPVEGSIRLNAPVRYYYLFRNSLLLHKRAHVPRSWVRYSRFKLVVLFLLYALFSHRRVETVGMMVRGLVDGLRGRTGAHGSAP